MAKQDPQELNILHETSARAFDSCFSLSRHLDIKASILLAFYAVLLIPTLEIIQWSTFKNINYFLKSIPAVLVSSGIVLCLIILIPKKFRSEPKLEGLEEIYNEEKSSDQLKSQLFSYYKDSLNTNKSIIKIKSSILKVSSWLSLISFLSIIFLYFFKGAIDGQGR